MIQRRLTKEQATKLRNHHRYIGGDQIAHSKKHIDEMRRLMLKGINFREAHRMATRMYGP